MTDMIPSGSVAPTAAVLVPATAPSSAAVARDSLQGLAFGDAFGVYWYGRFQAGDHNARAQFERRTVPVESPWRWTDDTAMALALLRVLYLRGAVDQRQLAESFAAFFLADPNRGYGYGMQSLLPLLAQSPDTWRAAARSIFGEGSLGSGGAMRVAPLGAWFHADVERAAEQAARSAEVTHAHPEGVAGAVAVAVAAALAVRGRGMTPPQPGALLAQIAEMTPAGAVRDGLLRAAGLPLGTPVGQALSWLCKGERGRASETVPFALWSAACHLDNLTEALWMTAVGGGDVDTNCAITGSVVAARTGVAALPPEWHQRREPLPGWV
ncbi:ADP-ribosylglycohydrolase family protein [Streptacidiphilus sp. MAP5-3]|uniref:ADP-ribosylglycohydrolase family protein n=1 Tax=unclassified Streptacidiphilus TaxID=2643834 RepID=UPI0035182FE4